MGALEGRVVIVTGAGRGLGRAYAQALTAHGARVVANDLDADALAELAVAAVHTGDASTADGAADLVAHALQRCGRIDGAIANAGVLRSGPILKLSAEDVDAVLAIHVRGTFVLAQAVGAHWRAEFKAERPVDAALVTTTSHAGLYGFRGEAIYSAAKAAVAVFTLVAADELGRYGATVNAVAPAARTRMTPWLDAQADEFAPEHVAPLVCWLVGPDARQVTGRVFEAGGGTLGVAEGWRPAARADLPPRADPDEVGRIAQELLAGSPEPPAILGATSW